MDTKVYQYYRQPGASWESPPSGPVGGGFFTTMASMALPLLQSLGKRVLRVAMRTLRDVWGRQRTLGTSLMEHTVRELQSSSEINKDGEERPNRKRKRAIDIFRKRLKTT